MMDAAQVNVELAMDSKMRVFGVDLGSQRCVVAAGVTGDVVLNELGGMTTATLVSFKGDERLIGEAAVLSSSTNPQNTVDYVNVLLGRELSAIHQRMATIPGQHVTFADDNSDSNKPVAMVDYLKGQSQFTMEQLLGMLLGKLAQQIRKKLQDDEHAHVTIAVPCGWGESQKKALRVAAAIAGLRSVQIVSRGAALAKCFHTKHPLPVPAENEDAPVKHIVVVDMGHTSTSVAAVKLTHAGETVLSVASDLELGSENFDLHLYEHFKQEAFEKQGLQVNHQGKEGKRLLQSCEKLKKLLSTIGEAAVSVENIVPDRDYTLKTTREQFEKLCAPETSRIRELVATVLSEAQLSSSDVASVEIVGGGTRIPFVQSAILSAFTGNDGEASDGTALIGRMLDSTTSVAVGAAFVDMNSSSLESDELMLTEQEQAQIMQLTALENEMQTRDTNLAAVAHERNAIEAFVYEMRSKRDTKHSDKIDFSALNPLLETAEDWIYSEESELATLESIRTKHREIREEIHSVCKDYFAAIDADERLLEAQLVEESRRAEAEREADGSNADDHDTRKLKKPERMRLVAKNKEEGNELFRDGNYTHAAVRYVKALSHASKFFDLNESDTREVAALKLSLYLNLAQCYLKLEQWGKAIANCKDALAIDAQNAKALYRRALALEKEKNWDEAVQDVKAALVVAPEDKAIVKLDERLKVQLKRQADKEKKMWSKAFA